MCRYVCVDIYTHLYIYKHIQTHLHLYFCIYLFILKIMSSQLYYQFQFNTTGLILALSLSLYVMLIPTVKTLGPANTLPSQALTPCTKQPSYIDALPTCLGCDIPLWFISCQSSCTILQSYLLLIWVLLAPYFHQCLMF